MKIVNSYVMTFNKEELIHIRELAGNLTADELSKMGGGLDPNLNTRIYDALFHAHPEDHLDEEIDYGN